MYPGGSIESSIKLERDKWSSSDPHHYYAVVKTSSGKLGLVHLRTGTGCRDSFTFKDAIDFADSVRAVVADARFFLSAELLRAHIEQIPFSTIGSLSRLTLLEGLPDVPKVKLELIKLNEPTAGVIDVLLIKGNVASRTKAASVLREAGLID